jgi:hypothetical protein
VRSSSQDITTPHCQLCALCSAVAAVEDNTRLWLCYTKPTSDGGVRHYATCVTLDTGDIIIFSAAQYHGGAAYPISVYPIGNVRYHCYLDGAKTKEYRRRGKSKTKDAFATVLNAGLEGKVWVERKQPDGSIIEDKLEPARKTDLPPEDAHDTPATTSKAEPKKKKRKTEKKHK